MSTLFFPAAIEIDGLPLTDQGRGPVDKSREEKSIPVELADGSTKKYIKAIKHNFSMSWSWLPDDNDQTIDGGMARKKMTQIIGESEETHLLRFYDRNGGYVEYTVWVDSYSETLTRRDAVSGLHFWDVSVGFKEQ